mmetsp:Transcript_25866/g.42702  ORF Transcript_25866/g.42702 Transcript_25866/m.42702 type:complete len:216 (+) Transcript_25866:182-829(+)
MVKFTAAKLRSTITLAILLLLLCSATVFNLTTATSTEEESSTNSATNNNNNDDNSEFFHTCSDGNYDKFQSLLTTNPSLIHATTKDGEHCLHLCAIGGNIQIVRTLLEQGADPNIRSTWQNGLRMHPLSWNTFYGRYEILELLLEYGADVEADFDLGGSVKDEKTGELEKVTVLDVVEKILSSEVDEEQRMRFAKTRNVLMKYGAVRYAAVEPEL